MIVNKFAIGDTVEFHNTYEAIMDGRKGKVLDYDTCFMGVFYTVEVDSKTYKNVSEDELL